jgi:hypothetical protein
MTEDGLFPIRYSDLLNRLENFSIFEEDDTSLWAENELGCRVVRRAAMGAGTPYHVLRVESDDAIIYPPEIRQALLVIGIDTKKFLLAC